MTAKLTSVRMEQHALMREQDFNVFVMTVCAYTTVISNSNSFMTTLFIIQTHDR